MALNQDLLNKINERVSKLLNESLQGKKWSDILQDPALTQSVYKIIVETLVGSDNSTVGKALLQALSDNKLDENDLQKVVTAWVLAQTGNDAVAQELIKALLDGKLTQDEAQKVILNWTKRQVKEPTISAFLNLVVAADGTLKINESKAKAMLLNYFKDRSGLPREVASPIADALDKGKLDTQGILAILAGWAAAADQERFSELLTRLAEEGQDTADVPLVVLSWLSGVDAGDLAMMFNLLNKGDYMHLLALILGALDPNFGGSVLKQLLDGKYMEVVMRTLTDALSQLGVNESGDLAKALVDLATGSRSLFAQPESSSLPFGRNAAAVAVWHEIQEVIFYAQLFVGTGLGQIVSDNQQAKPHLIRASEVGVKTPVSNLVADPSKKPQREVMAKTLTLMLDRHFKGRILAFGDSLVLDESDFKSGSGVVCLIIASRVFSSFVSPL